MKRKVLITILLVGLTITAALYWVLMIYPQRFKAPLPPQQIETSSPTEKAESVQKIEQEMLAQIAHERNPNPSRRLILPPPPIDTPEEAEPAPPPPAPLTPRAEGRKKREGLPMGVVLWNNVSVYDQSKEGKVLYRMNTGDLVRVFADNENRRWHVQPGLDVYLIATTKEIAPAGEHLPDQDGWVDKANLQIFEPAAAKEYMFELSPVTLGNDTSFSTTDFYERAMKNPDPVVHRVVGPRLIALVLLHEDYSTSWSKLYRDSDPKIRDAALSALHRRGVGNSRTIVEDLIIRLTELTKTRATDEREAEVLSILSTLKESGLPRVPAALASFKEAWKDTQSERVNKALQHALEPPQ